MRPDPRKIAEIPPYDKAGTALGKLYRPDGKEITGVIGAGRSGPASSGVGLKPPWNSKESTMTWHVEGHMAAIMRMMKIKDAVLYLNTGPCKKPSGCKENLAAVLPVGYTLHLIWREPSGATRVAKFRGNGRGLLDR